MKTQTARRPDGLTERQAEVVRALYRLAERHGRPPTVRQVVEAIGVAGPNSYMTHFRFLAKKGWVLPQEVAVYAGGAARLAGMSLRVVPGLGTCPVLDTEPDGRGGFRLTARAEKLRNVVFGATRSP